MSDNSSLEPIIPIKLLGTEEEKKRLANLINRVAKSKLGKETLTIAAEAGYTLDIGLNVPEASGFCDDKKKALSISSNFSDDMLIIALVHEARHACQYARGAGVNAEHDSVKSQIIITRAMEADAERAACVACFEMKQYGDTKAYYAFSRVTKHIIRPFEEALRNGENADAAAFKGWYSDKRLKSIYENVEIVEPLQEAQKNGKDKEMMFDKNHSCQEIADKICFTENGKNYLGNDVDFLEENGFADIGNDTKELLQKFMLKREKKSDLVPDKSINELPTKVESEGFRRKNSVEQKTIDERQEDASKKIASKKLSKEKAVQAAVIASVKQKTL